MSDRLFLERECEHGSLESHFLCDAVGYPEYDEMEHSEEKCVCDGGERREVVVDYSAAELVFRQAGYNNKGLRVLLDQAVIAALRETEAGPE